MIAVGGEPSSTIVIVALAWWAISIILGFWLGRPERAREDMRDVLAKAKMATSLPSESPNRIAAATPLADRRDRDHRRRPRPLLPRRRDHRRRLRPDVSLACHTREAAVQAIEERDGVRFFVVPSPAFKPIELVRTPGLRSDRLNAF